MEVLQARDAMLAWSLTHIPALLAELVQARAKLGAALRGPCAREGTGRALFCPGCGR